MGKRFTVYADLKSGSGTGDDYETAQSALAAAKVMARKPKYARVWVREYAANGSPRTIWDSSGDPQDQSDNSQFGVGA